MKTDKSSRKLKLWLSIGLCIFLSNHCLSKQMDQQEFVPTCYEVVTSRSTNMLLDLVKKWLKTSGADSNGRAQLLYQIQSSSHLINPFSDLPDRTGVQLSKAADLVVSKLSNEDWMEFVKGVELLMGVEEERRQVVEKIDQETSEVINDFTLEGRLNVSSTDVDFTEKPQWIQLADGRRFVLAETRGANPVYQIYEYDSESGGFELISELSGLINYIFKKNFKISPVGTAKDQNGIVIKVVNNERDLVEVILFRVDLNEGRVVKLVEYSTVNGAYPVERNGKIYFQKIKRQRNEDIDEGRNDIYALYDFGELDVQSGKVRWLSSQWIFGFNDTHTSVSDDGVVQWYDGHSMNPNVIATFDTKSREFQSAGVVKTTDGIGKRLVRKLFGGKKEESRPNQFSDRDPSLIYYQSKSGETIAFPPEGGPFYLHRVDPETNKTKLVNINFRDYESVSVLESETGDIYMARISKNPTYTNYYSLNIYKLNFIDNTMESVFETTTFSEEEEPFHLVKSSDGRVVFLTLSKKREFSLHEFDADRGEVIKLSSILLQRHSIGEAPIYSIHTDKNGKLSILVLDQDRLFNVWTLFGR